ncbi:hypothetical protein DRN76_01150, partial [Methanosarcinales archaeon]
KVDYENSPKGITAQNKGERIIDCTLLEMKYVFRAEVKKTTRFHEITTCIQRKQKLTINRTTSLCGK